MSGGQTAGEPDAAVDALIASLGDPEPAVSSAAATSLEALGAARVLPAVLKFLTSPAGRGSSMAAWVVGTSSLAQRIAILNVGTSVASTRRLKQKTNASHDAKALPSAALLPACIEEVLTASEVAHAEAAGALLAELARHAPNDAAEKLVAHCPPGALPSPGILVGLGDLAQASPPVVVPVLKRELLPRLLPLLGACKGDARIPLGRALHCFAEAIASHEGAGAAAAERAGGGAQTFASEMHAAIELLLAGWLASRSDRVRDAACEAIGSMVVLLPPSTLRSLVPRLVPGLLASQRREYEWERFPITSALWATLVHCEACALGREMHSEQILLPVVQTLLQAVCSPLDRSSASCLRNHNEVGGAFPSLFICPRALLLLLPLPSRAAPPGRSCLSPDVAAASSPGHPSHHRTSLHPHSPPHPILPCPHPILPYPHPHPTPPHPIFRRSSAAWRRARGSRWSRCSASCCSSSRAATATPPPSAASWRCYAIWSPASASPRGLTRAT